MTKHTAFFEKILFSATLVCALCGCVSNSVPVQKPAALPVDRVSEKVSSARRAALRSILGAKELRGVVVYPHSWKNHSAVSVVSKAASYGFNSIFFVVSCESEFDDFLKELVTCASHKKIASYIVLRGRDFVNRPRGNAFIRKFREELPDIAGAAKLAERFNDNPEKGAGNVAGLVVLIEPHRYNFIERSAVSSASCFTWKEDTFGIGLDNDMLMRKSLDDFRKISVNIPVTPAIADFYHEWALENKLSQCRISDIAALSNSGKVILLSSANKPGMIAENMKNEFSSCGNTQLVPVVLVAGHLSVEKNKLRRRNFSDFIRGVNYGKNKIANLKQCGGFITGPLRALEYMCCEKE